MPSETQPTETQPSDARSTNRMPALSLVSVPGKRSVITEAVVEMEQRGFSGVFCPSLGDAMSLCLTIAHVTETIEFGTAIQPIYLQHPAALAGTAGYIDEVSGGRFKLGIGVTHGPVHKRLGIDVGKPLSDTREYVGAMRKASERSGGMPPIVLAALRDKMVGLATEVGEGAVWANAARSHMGHSLSVIAKGIDDGADQAAADAFFVGNMIPTVIDDDREAAAARNRSTMVGYVSLPNYRNYWREAGYDDEMDAVEAALPSRDKDTIMAAMSDRWLADCTLYGSVGEVREGVEAWFDAGVNRPILVPSSTSGGQLKAIEEVFAAYQ